MNQDNPCLYCKVEKLTVRRVGAAEDGSKLLYLNISDICVNPECMFYINLKYVPTWEPAGDISKLSVLEVTYSDDRLGKGNNTKGRRLTKEGVKITEPVPQPPAFAPASQLIEKQVGDVSGDIPTLES